MRALVAICGLAVLAACESVVSAESEAYLALYDENVALVNRVAAMPVASTILSTGTLTYFGTAGLAMDTDPATASVADTSLLGEAVLVADFDGDDIDGSIGNFVGVINGGPAEFFAGELTLTDGDLRVVSVAQFTADVGGTLSADGNVVVVDGELAGFFRRDSLGTDGLYAASQTNSDFYLNGVEYVGLFGVVGVE